MNKNMKKFIYWLPRILVILFIAFISIFALDVFGEYQFPEVLLALFMHLIPSFVLITVLIIAWKWELIGGLFFIALAIFSIFFFKTLTDPIVFLIISLPAILIGILFILNHYIKK